jgi:CheY-like chemotaxis protein
VAARILVVDDQPDVVELLCLQLERAGHTCIAAASGSEALALAAEHRPEVILLDIGLPDMSGYEVARALRARADGNSFYLAALTGYGTAEDRRRAFAAGFDRHLLKPAKSSEIAELLIDAGLRHSGNGA